MAPPSAYALAALAAFDASGTVAAAFSDMPVTHDVRQICSVHQTAVGFENTMDETEIKENRKQLSLASVIILFSLYQLSIASGNTLLYTLYSIMYKVCIYVVMLHIT